MLQCKTCRSEYASVYYKNNPEAFAERQRRAHKRTPDRRREQRLKAQYNITPEQYEQMFESQGGGCAICHRPPTNYRLNIDHDHKTGLIRGLLCWACNRALGGFKDDAERLNKAAEYINSPPACKSIGPVYGRTGRVTKRRRKSTKKKETV